MDAPAIREVVLAICGDGPALQPKDLIALASAAIGLSEETILAADEACEPWSGSIEVFFCGDDVPEGATPESALWDGLAHLSTLIAAKERLSDIGPVKLTYFPRNGGGSGTLLDDVEQLREDFLANRAEWALEEEWAERIAEGETPRACPDS
jgi:hypothetical protein